MRQQALPAAQIITPNQFELESLTGLPVSTTAELLSAADAARSLGPDVVLVTSVVRRDGPQGSIGMVAVNAAGAARDDTKAVPNLHGKRGRHGGDLSRQPSGHLRRAASTGAYRGGDLWAPRGHSYLRSCRACLDRRSGGTRPSQPRL